MSTITFEVSPSGVADGPACDSCGGPTRLVGIEPHLKFARTDLRTFECPICKETQTVVTPLPN